MNELLRLQRAARKLSYRLDVLLRVSNDFDGAANGLTLSYKGKVLSTEIDKLISDILAEHNLHI